MMIVPAGSKTPVRIIFTPLMLLMLLISCHHRVDSQSTFKNYDGKCLTYDTLSSGSAVSFVTCDPKSDKQTNWVTFSTGPETTDGPYAFCTGPYYCLAGRQKTLEVVLVHMRDSNIMRPVMQWADRSNTFTSFHQAVNATSNKNPISRVKSHFTIDRLCLSSSKPSGTVGLTLCQAEEKDQKFDPPHP